MEEEEEEEEEHLRAVMNSNLSVEISRVGSDRAPGERPGDGGRD